MTRWIFASVLALSFGFAPAAAGPCLAERDMAINTAEVAAFGSTRNFPTLPLKANEYVLTFDDGPWRATTPSLLKILKDTCVHGTFFMLGRYADKMAPLVKDIVAEGHTLGSHGYDHTAMVSMPPDVSLDEIRRGKNAVEWAAGPGQRDLLFRFPDNVETPELIAQARSLGLTVASYDFSPADWRGDDPAVTLARFKKLIQEHDRGVIVMHDRQPNTVLFLPFALDALRARHAVIVRLRPS